MAILLLKVWKMADFSTKFQNHRGIKFQIFQLEFWEGISRNSTLKLKPFISHLSPWWILYLHRRCFFQDFRIIPSYSLHLNHRNDGGQFLKNKKSRLHKTYYKLKLILFVLFNIIINSSRAQKIPKKRNSIFDGC